jgi:perosamine synthetase
MKTKPAILGGSREVTLDGKSANRWPVFTIEDEEAVLRVLRDGDLSCHPVTRELEKEYRDFFGVRHALAHCNGTAALLAAFFSLDLRPGDEVLVPSATFWASVIPMLWVGAIPVFCESELEQLGLDPENVERKITERTRAMVIVHLWGMPSRMKELMEIAKRHDLKVIEDASHAQGATYHGKKCGTFGDISVFSLQSSKLAPAGEGGILLTNHDEYWERALCLGDMVRIWELESPSRVFGGTTFGIKTRMAPLSAAVGRVQFRHLQERNQRRNANITYLSHHLERLGFDTFLPPNGVERVYFEFLILANPEQITIPTQTLIAALQEEGCEVSVPRYPLLHQQPLFTERHFQKILQYTSSMMYAADALPKSEAAMKNLIRLPSFPFAEKDLLDQYIEAFEKVLQYQEEIANCTIVQFQI